MHIESTNRDSKVILGYYLQAIGQLGGKCEHYYKECFGYHYSTAGCPQIVRMDLGSENTGVAHYHAALRMNHTDDHAGARSIKYGSSPTNSVRET